VVPEKSVRACRTQIVTEVADAAKMVRNWGGGVLEGDRMTLLHRIVCTATTCKARGTWQT
jgi:hypothetical protein